MSVTAYDVLRAKSSDDLKAQVTASIGNGWQPFGQPFVTEEHFVCQAMITGSQVLVGATGAAGTNGTDGTVKTFYGTTSSVANTYTATITGATPLTVGSIFAIKFTHAPTGAATININSTGPVPIIHSNGTTIADQQGIDGQVGFMSFDGTSMVYIVSPNIG